MNIFNCEKDMQEWLSSELKKNDGSFISIICNVDQFNDFYREGKIKHKVLDSFYRSLSSLYETKILSEDKNISYTSGESLKPDFVLYSYSNESLILVELKNSKNATREAGTELGAYNYELSSYFPNMPKLDFVHIIISNYFPTLLLHCIRNMILIQGLNVLCLMPVCVEGLIRLQIIDYQMILNLNLFPYYSNSNRIPASLLQSFQVCIYDDELQKGGNDFNRLDKYINLLKTALNNMSLMGEKLNSNGFAILWKDRNTETSLAPYSISVVYMPAYEQIKLLDREYIDVYRNMNKALNEFPSVVGVSILAIANEVEKLFLFDENISIRYEGFMDFRMWSKIDPSRCDYQAFVSWGELFRGYHMQLLHELSDDGFYLNENNAYVACEFLNFCIDINQ